MDEQQNNFSDRLRRIEAQKGPRPARPVRETPPPEMIEGGGSGGSGVGLGRLVLIFVVLIALVGFGGLYLISTLTKDVATDQVASDSDAATPPGETEAEAVPPVLAFTVDDPDQTGQPPAELRDQGWLLRTGIVANAERAEVTVESITADFDPTVPDLNAGRVEMFDPNPNCTLRRPGAGEVVHNVRLEAGTGRTDLHVVSDAAIADAVKDHVQGITATDKKYLVGKTARGRMGRVDVFVTDTSAPVYLVLQNLAGNTLWNIHRGPGVRLAHVALIGNTPGVILPDGVGFEALRVSDFVGPHKFGAYDEIEPCMIRPWRQPEPHWPAQQKAENGNDLFVNQMHSFSTGYRSFNAWFTETLGIDAGTNLVAALGAAHVLVGPVPESPLGYNRIQGRKVHLVRTGSVFRNNDELIEAHRDLLTRAAGGDAALIDLPPMEFASQ